MSTLKLSFVPSKIGLIKKRNIYSLNHNFETIMLIEIENLFHYSRIYIHKFPFIARHWTQSKIISAIYLLINGVFKYEFGKN